MTDEKRPDPWKVRHTGELCERETDKVVGSVLLRSGLREDGAGWYGYLNTAPSIVDDGSARGPFITKKDAARDTWQRYAQPRCEHEHQQYGRCVRCGMPSQHIFVQRVTVDGEVFVDPETMEALTAEQAGARAAWEATEQIEASDDTVTIPKADAEALLKVLSDTRSKIRDPHQAMKWGREKKRLMDLLIDRTQP